MRVLVACERSGVVRSAFRARGHQAWSCDVVPSEDGGPHIQADVLTLLATGWDMALFFPDCTYLTCSAEWAYGDGPYHQRVKPGTLVGAARRKARNEAKAFVLKLWNSPIHRIAIENPVGVLSSVLGRHAQTIQPYEFGHDASKRTCLWLKNLPPLRLDPEQYVKPRMWCPTCKHCSPYDAAFKHGCSNCGTEPGLLRPRWANQTDSGQNKLSPGEGRAMERARTYEGVAKAMSEQWNF